MLLMAFGACENNRDTDCSECVTDKNGDSKLCIHISNINDNSSGYPIKIYEGPIENNNLLYEFTMYIDYCEYSVIADKNYTVTAEYNIEGVKYIAVESVRPTIKYDDSSCDEPCYYVYDNVVNLRLKYTK